MTSNRTQLIARLSILTALTVVLGYYTKLPTPTGIVTLLDLGAYFTAFYFGRKEGAIVGGVGAFLLDLISGYPQWMFFSLLFHGGQGYFAGFKGKARYLGLLLATVVMVGASIPSFFNFSYAFTHFSSSDIPIPPFRYHLYYMI